MPVRPKYFQYFRTIRFPCNRCSKKCDKGTGNTGRLCLGGGSMLIGDSFD
jgi:hypothetical protein